MDEINKKKYQMLMKKNRHKLESMMREQDVLYNECLEHLKEYEVTSLEETNEIFKYISSAFPMTSYGKFDWANMTKFVKTNDIQEMVQLFNTQDVFYILWDKYNLPSIKCKLYFILNALDDVLAVGFKTWLLSSNKKELIEFYSNENVVCGSIE